MRKSVFFLLIFYSSQIFFLRFSSFQGLKDGHRDRENGLGNFILGFSLFEEITKIAFQGKP